MNDDITERDPELETWLDERDEGLTLEELMGELAPTEEPEAA